MKSLNMALAIAVAVSLTACGHQPAKSNDQRILNEQDIEGTGTTKVKAEIWVDNWFAMSVNGAPLIEDSVPFKTERSFNAERVTFSTDLPATVAFEFRDFRQNDTGLEYIGTGRQQVGDGGAIVQFTNAETGEFLKGSDASWRCLVINHAPADQACARESNPMVGEGVCAAVISEAPDGWTEPGFDDSKWATATEHSVRAVSPKDGYDVIDWNPGAKLIWGDDLKLDNTLLCRAVIDG